MSRDVEKDWDEFWKPLVTKEDGTVDMEQVKKELSDYNMILEEVPKVYEHVTGGTLSKPNYPADVVITQADDHLNEVVEDEIKDIIACHLSKKDAQRPLGDLLDELDDLRRYPLEKAGIV